MNQLYSPTSFYRLQFHAGFTFAHALKIVPYLRDMGISHIYTSPILAARPGSTHGYDIVDHQSLNPELGGREGFDALSTALQKVGMGLVMDIVPNHMGIGRSDNLWWLDVLEWGRASRYAHYFDIQWFPETQGIHDQVLLPVLGDLYGAVLERGELRLRFEAVTGSFSVWYHEHRFPLCPSSYHRILQPCLEQAGLDTSNPEDIHAALIESKQLRFKPRTGTRRKALRTRGETFKKTLSRLVVDFPELHQALEQTERTFGPEAFDGRGLERLHTVLEQQHYRPAYWRVASHEINYRRFFQINDLAGLRVEVPEVFAAAHSLIQQLVSTGQVHGLRIDHIDGLYDPPGYLDQLQKLVEPYAEVLGFTPGRFPVYVEKILEEHESLRDHWSMHGSTGYDALSEINAVQVNADGLAVLRALYASREGAGSADAHAEGVQAKRQVMDQELASELEVLATETNRLLKRDPTTRDFSRAEIRQALREIVCRFPVYRTYVGPKGPSIEDSRDLDWALGLARRARAVSHPRLFDVLESLLKATWKKRADGRARADVLRLARKFQQFTGPAMAKGMEDTTFYRVVPLTSMNEVGMGPDRRVSTVGDFHRQMESRSTTWPEAMLTTATHDTKRSEDVRARIAVLSEVPTRWAEHVERWQTLNRRARQGIAGVIRLSSRDEYLFYQTLVGVWPLADLGHDPPAPAVLATLRDRLQAYMIKAAREAKINTSWLNPDEEYEKALIDFVAQVLDGSPVSMPFLRDMQELVRTMSAPGFCNSLAQMVLRLTMPGAPDNYQGTELWDDSLVDPDNRRAVDYSLRKKNLHAFKQAEEHGELARLTMALGSAWPDSRLKHFVLWRLLTLRRTCPDLFLRGRYIPLEVNGPQAEHIIAFARTNDHQSIFVAVPRHSALLCAPGNSLPTGSGWTGTCVMLDPLIKGSKNRVWSNLFTAQNTVLEKRQVAGSALFAALPVCVMIQVDQSDVDC
ncbi:malto-oligosyltrehalose synthase [Desulfobulbus alkaliphilus]|uniref:malto-oligosyltrehalose synthase n=1 Tax=Desulfobulbus alkaliphilus TaxID=869814 RepID=UPI001965428D|nr:malto-oligosyltrehalose synthase [Desulfobulbus alkaliphilus]MBM9536116.1 malto-oligosyltrehalose synthase [Desulfobulbus alkaliphilus]